MDDHCDCGKEPHKGHEMEEKDRRNVKGVKRGRRKGAKRPGGMRLSRRSPTPSPKVHVTNTEGHA